jgi:putative endonuclease
MKGGFVYIMMNKYNTTLYTGVTANLKKRVYEHKSGTGSFFVKKYKLIKLVWFDEFPSIEEAITREKQIKKWKRQWKIEMIQKMNPSFSDLYEEI